MAWLGRRRLRGGVSEALAVLVLTLVLVVGVLLAASLGARMLHRLGPSNRVFGPAVRLDAVYFDPGACVVNVSLYVPPPGVYVAEVVLVLKDNSTITHYLGEVIEGEYDTFFAACSPPTALAVIGGGGTEVFNLT